MARDNAWIRRIEYVLGRVALGSYRRPLRALVLTLALSVAALFGARELRVDTDLAHLLPDSFQSVQDLDALMERAGSIGYVVVVLEGETPEALRALAHKLAPTIEALPSISYVDYERPVEWFKDRALYFADVAQLDEARKRLTRRERWEARRHNPMYLDLEQGEPPPLEFEDLKKRGAAAPRWLTGSEQRRYYEDVDKRMLVMLARPLGRSTDMQFSRHVVEEVQGVLARVWVSPEAPDARLSITGRFKKKLDQQQQITSDLALSSGLALLLVLAYLLLHFRRASAVTLLIVPLLLGLLWTFGAVGYLYGTLNLLSAFAGVILLGLGIDHGIHLLSAYDNQQALGVPPERAIETSFAHTGRAVVVASLTTIAGFLGVSLSAFRAFREFGVVAAIGMATVVLSYLVCLPAALSLRRRLRVKKLELEAPLTKLALKFPKPAALISLGLVMVMLTPLYRLSFDYDFAALEDANLPSFQLDREVNRVLGYSQTPTIVLARDAEEEQQVTSALRRVRSEQPNTTTIDMVASVADLVPDAQIEKQTVIQRIGKVVSRVKASWLPEQDRVRREELVRMTATPPFARADLPPEVTRQFRAPKQSGDSRRVGAGDGFVLVFPNISLSDGEKIPQFAGELREAAGSLPVAGESMVLADILDMVRRESPTVLLFTVGLVSLTLWLLIGSLGRAVFAFAAAVLTVLTTLGVVAAWGFSLNYLNIIVIPVLFGIAVDGAVHLLGSRELGPAAIGRTARAISGALLTTGLGFAVLMLAEHPGLRSVGQLAVAGLAVNALLSLLMIPSLFVLSKSELRRRQEVLI